MSTADEIPAKEAATCEQTPSAFVSCPQLHWVLAPKLQMQQAVMRELRLEVVPEPADVADALAIALCHHYLAKTKLPA